MSKIKFKKKYLDIFNKSKFPFEGVFNNQNTDRWMKILLSALEQYKRLPYDGSTEYKHGDDTDCYVSFIMPFMRVSELELMSRPGVFYKTLNSKCRFELERQLVNKLVRICSKTLLSCFKESQQSCHENDVCVGDYVNQVYKKPMVFFKEYIVLARLLAMHTDFWIQSTIKLIKRIQEDYSQFDALFFREHSDISGAEIVKSISEIRSGLSDPHELAQTVTIIGFVNGEKVVYKPKSVIAEHGFGVIVDWLNDQSSLQFNLKYLPVIDKKCYGWVRFVEHKSCDNDNEINGFYSRLGMISALLYVLRGMDYHHENLIAHGQYPFFIDHEMLFYPIYIDPANRELASKSISDIQAGYYESVMNTRLYPIIEKRVNGSVADVSAVGFCSDAETNTNLPVGDCKKHAPERYLSNITTGFENVYNIIKDNQDALLYENDGLLNIFVNSEFRFNIRSTSSYLSINNLCLSAESLKSGDNFCNSIHAIQNQMRSIFSHGVPADLMLEEAKVLSRLDVPRFTLKSSDKHLISAGNNTAKIFKFSGIELVKQRIRDMSESDLSKQIKYIEKAVES